MPVLATHGRSSEPSIPSHPHCAPVFLRRPPHLGRMCFSYCAQRRSESHTALRGFLRALQSPVQSVSTQYPWPPAARTSHPLQHRLHRPLEEVLDEQADLHPRPHRLLGPAHRRAQPLHRRGRRGRRHRAAGARPCLPPTDSPSCCHDRAGQHSPCSTRRTQPVITSFFSLPPTLQKRVLVAPRRRLLSSGYR